MSHIITKLFRIRAKETLITLSRVISTDKGINHLMGPHHLVDRFPPVLDDGPACEEYAGLSRGAYHRKEHSEGHNVSEKRPSGK